MIDRKHHSGDPDMMPFHRIERVIVSPNNTEAVEDRRSALVVAQRNERLN
jgi:hypothetical protein